MIVQSECEKRLADYPSLNNSQHVCHVKPNREQPSIVRLSCDQRSPINLSKKRKFQEENFNSINTPFKNHKSNENCLAND